MPSGTIGAARLPVLPDWAASGQVIVAETTSSPRAAVIEVSITKCRGVIDTTGGACYLRSTNGSLTNATWLQRTPSYGSWTDSNAATLAAQSGLCMAYASTGSFYVNMRYTYDGGQNCTLGVCGFVSQWNYGSW
jgi:hypothetical protein